MHQYILNGTSTSPQSSSKNVLVTIPPVLFGIFDGEMRLARPRGHSVALVATLVDFARFHNMVTFFQTVLIEIDRIDQNS